MKFYTPSCTHTHTQRTKQATVFTKTAKTPVSYGAPVTSMIKNWTTSTTAADANKKPERNDASIPTARRKNNGRQTAMQIQYDMQGGIQGEGRREARRLGGGLHAGTDPQATGRPGGLARQTPTDERNTMAQDGSRWLKRQDGVVARAGVDRLENAVSTEYENNLRNQ